MKILGRDFTNKIFLDVWKACLIPLMTLKSTVGNQIVLNESTVFVNVKSHSRWDTGSFQCSENDPTGSRSHCQGPVS